MKFTFTDRAEDGALHFSGFSSESDNWKSESN